MAWVLLELILQHNVNVISLVLSLLQHVDESHIEI